MSKTPVLTSKAPKPLPGIYSQAIIANGTVYCSGAIAMDAETGKVVEGDIQVCPMAFRLTGSMTDFVIQVHTVERNHDHLATTYLNKSTAQMHLQPHRDPRGCGNNH